MKKGFKVYSIDVIERAGFEFKVSSNNFDGHVLIFVKNNFLGYTGIKSFPTAKSAREWIDNLVNLTKSAAKYILDNDS